MQSFETFDGTEYRFRPRGAGRFFLGAFLGVWLCGWAFGEVTVIGLLVGGAWSAFTGQAIQGKHVDLLAPGLWAMAAFLLVWLSLWTVGGVAAAFQLARSLWGSERLVLRADGLRLFMKAFPFWSLKEIHVNEIQGMHRLGKTRGLLLSTSKGKIKLVGMATCEENDELQRILERWFPALRAGVQGVFLGKNWQMKTLDDGRRVLSKDPRIGLKQGIALGVVCLVSAGLSVVLVLNALVVSGFWIGAMICAGLSCLAGWGAWRVQGGRTEYVLGRGRVIVRSVFREREIGTWEALFLELSEHKDSEGDCSYTLKAKEDPYAGTGKDRKPREKCLARSARDPLELQDLARWIVSKTEIRFEDLTLAERKPVDWSELKQKLASSGRLGEWLAGRIKK